jgi:hypothetical protein
MFNTQQNNMGLMFNPQQPMSQFVQWQMNAPPFMPGNIQIPPVVQPYYTAICSLVANEITGAANQHAGRMYTFNQVSSNNWQNNYFVELVTIAVDMVSMNIAKQQHPTVDQAVVDGVRQAIGLFVSMNIVEQQGLHQMLESNILQSAISNVSQMHGLKNEITHYKNMLLQSMQQQPAFQQQMGYSNPGFTVNPAFTNRMNPGGMQQNFNQPQHTPINNGSQSMFTNTGPSTGFVNPNPVQANSRYASYANNTSKPAVSEAPQEQSKYAKYTQVPTPEPVQKPTAEYEIVSRNDWEWSIHHPVRDTIIDKLSARLEWRRYHNNGAPYVKSVVIPLTGEEMEKAAHQFNENATQGAWDSALSKGFANPAEAHRAVREKAITSVVVTTARDKAIAQKSEITARVSKTTHVDASVNGVLIDMSLTNQDVPDNELVREYIQVVTPIITKVENNGSSSSLLDQLDSMKHMHITQVATALSNMVKDGPEQVENVANAINEILTTKTNELLRNNFSLKVQIDSFMEDVAELPKYLSDKYGEAVVNKFLAMNDFIIKNTLIVVEDSVLNLEAQTTEESIEGAEALESIKPKPVNFISILLGSIYSASFINRHSKDLNLHKTKEQEAVADPVLENVCKNIFNCRERINNQTSVWLLVTADYKVFRLHKGALTGSFDSFTIESFKQ